MFNLARKWRIKLSKNIKIGNARSVILNPLKEQFRSGNQKFNDCFSTATSELFANKKVRHAIIFPINLKHSWASHVPFNGPSSPKLCWMDFL